MALTIYRLLGALSDDSSAALYIDGSVLYGSASPDGRSTLDCRLVAHTAFYTVLNHHVEPMLRSLSNVLSMFYGSVLECLMVEVVSVCKSQGKSFD